MLHCHGGGFPDPLFGLPVEGQCGSTDEHDEHDVTDQERVCMGSPMSFVEAPCGRGGPHGSHPLNEVPVISDEASDQ